MDRMVARAAIIGVGLIGGSLGLALRRRGLAGQVTGVSRRPESLQTALARGAIDEAAPDVPRAVANADLVVLATPVGLIVPLAEAARPALAPDALVIDAGSTKAHIVAALDPLVSSAGARFVGCHPLAGSEKRSVAAADADLFEGAVTVLTPTARTDSQAADRAEALWRAVGSRTVRVAPGEHDALVARTSHLPHVVAFALALTVAGERASGRSLDDFLAGGFRDTTRIAASDPDLWRDILLDNRDEVLAALEAFEGRLGALRALMARGDGEALRALLSEAKEARDACPRSPLAGG